MNEPFTPTTKYVRRVYSLAPVDLEAGGMTNTSPDYAAAQFDRWLAQHDSEVRLKAIRDAAKAVSVGVQTAYSYRD